MRAVVQRVSQAEVRVESQRLAAIDAGLLVYLSVAETDDDSDLRWMGEKLVGLRLFPDESGKMNRSVLDVGGAILLVSNFTLHGDASKGRRPSFTAAARPQQAEPMFEKLAAWLAERLPTRTGRFAAHMHVQSENDGPVTILLDSRGTV